MPDIPGETEPERLKYWYDLCMSVTRHPGAEPGNITNAQAEAEDARDRLIELAESGDFGAKRALRDIGEHHVPQV